MWKPVDWLADWLADRLDAHNQLRLGILLVLFSLPLFAYAPFSGEPPVIYLMSAAALTISGITTVVSAEVLLNQEENGEGSKDGGGHGD